MDKIEMKDPTDDMLESPLFNAIWEVIKTWDINVPESYDGYCEATGNHVRAILDALNEKKMSEWQPIDTAPKDGSVFLLLIPSQMNLIIRCKYSTIHKHFQTDFNDSGITRTHFMHKSELWQPIPELPKIADE